MNVLIACEFSGVVRDAFTSAGHYAMSCDLLFSEKPGNHYRGTVQDLFDGIAWGAFEPFDLMIAFPPCTHLACSGARWFKEKETEQQEAADFFLWLASAPIAKIAIENPIGVMSTRWRKPDQIIQPWQFGHGETKATCLWLKGLPPLTHTHTLWKAGKRVSTGWLLHLSAAKNAVAPTLASRTPWRSNGVH